MKTGAGGGKTRNTTGISRQGRGTPGRTVPGPTRILGEKRPQDPLGLLLRGAIRYGGFVRFRYPREDVYLVAAPELIRHVLVVRPENYAKGYQSLEVLLGKGIVLTEGEEWRGCRARARATFSEEHLHRLALDAQSATQAMLRQWGSHSSLDVEVEMVRLTQSIIARWMFGTTPEELVRRSFEILRKCLSSEAGARRPEFRKALGEVDRWVLRLIRRGACGGGLDALLGSGDERIIRDEVLSLFIPGYETSSSLLSWILHFLSVFPEMQARVRHDSAYRGRMIEETLRFYPPACSFARRALGDDVLGGYPIRAGSKVVISPYVTHHLPELWVEPEAFLPDRFATPPPPFTYLPFGAGPRICIGARMAMTMAELVTSNVLGQFSLAPCPGKRVRPHAGVTLRPKKGLWLKVAAMTETSTGSALSLPHGTEARRLKGVQELRE